ncbi:motility associated factor glycosyltransferase family protein [Cohnella xylanilytica]|uniref:Motility associated factor glycosyltransferase family protein n=1 Tax=Cohnella xylanilytica TaxID=557555 RepID=A0A841TV82_9BACL|nr:6-hydroxymethylpterin diphosphokinase MptE-like protein [Cohnella xylanilytica]MBB6692196.1 motility associated factor glycosyltransferase family protein [Cohnella xylanilytica]
MTTFQANLSFLEQRFPYAHHQLIPASPQSTGYEPFLSEDGLGNIRIQRSGEREEFLYDPSQTSMDVARWLQAQSDSISQHDHLLLYGLGIGHHLQVLLTFYPDKWIYIYEPDTELFRAALQAEDMTAILSHENVKALAVGSSTEAKRQLIYPICTHAQGSCAFLYMPYYARTNAEGIEQFREEIPAIVSEFQVNRNTRNLFKEQWLVNRLYHLSTNLNSTPLHALKGRFKGVPAIIVGSGPSLKEDVEWIRQLRRHCLILSAGTSVQPLLHFGIEPHLVALVDGGAIVEKVFQDSVSRSVPMLYSPTTNYRVTDSMNSSLFHFFDHTDPVSKHYMALTDEDPVFNSSASVTGMAIQAAVYMGCREIVFAGQDFSFPGEVHYAPGVTHFGEEGQKYVVSHAQVLVENVLGTMNRTNTSYHVLLRNTEEIISQLAGIRFINTSSVGAKIKGTEWMRMEEYYKGIRESNIRSPERIDTVDAAAGFYSNERLAMILTRVKLLSDDLHSYQQELNEMKKLIGKLADWSRTNPSKCTKALETIEDKWSAVVNRDSFTALYESLLPEELHYFDNHLSLIVAERTLIGKARLFEIYLGKIVQEMLEATPKLQAMAAEAMARIGRFDITDAINAKG